MTAEAQLWISRELAERIRRHGAEAYPHECCGALLGRDHTVVADAERANEKLQPSREVLGIFPLINRREDSPRNRFSVTAEDVRVAEHEAAKHGLDVVGWYHSHPDHPARPSEYDREHAWPWYSYVIVRVAQGVPEEMTSWRLSNDRSAFACEPIEVRRAAVV